MWFVNSNNQQLGPFDERDIAVGLARGVYNAHTMVWREGWPSWLALAKTELAKHLSTASSNAQKGKGMKTFLWAITALGSVLGSLIVIFGVTNATGAPQEAAAAAIGLSFAVIPYCLARAASELGN